MTMTSPLSTSTRSDPVLPLAHRHSRAQTDRRSQRTSFTSSVSESFHIVADKIALRFGSNPNWERLNEIERRRLNVLGRTDVSFFRMLFYWDGTVLQAVITKPMLWITLAIYIAVRIGARWDMPSFVSTLGSTDTAVIGGFLTFFLVFHVHDSMGRFNTLFNASKDGRGRILSIAALAHTYLPRNRALRLIRYLNAAHVASYVGLSDVYTFDAFFQPLNEAQCLLTEEEVMRMKCINMDEGASAFQKLVVWSYNDVAEASNKGLISDLTAWDLRFQIIRMRDSFQEMHDIISQPIPFFMDHFIVLISFIYLPLVAVSQGLNAGTGENVYWMKDVVQGVVIFLQSLVLIGLKALSDMLSNPYGDDLQDLSVLTYIKSTWESTNRMLNAAAPDTDLEMEEEIFSKAEDIGSAWSRFGFRVEEKKEESPIDNDADKRV